MLKLFSHMAVLVSFALPATTYAKQDYKVHAKPKCNTHACEVRVLRKKCSQRNVVPCIKYASWRWHYSYGTLYNKASCESTLNPMAVGYGVHYGLFQFLPSTFKSTPYRGHWIFSAKWNSLAAAWMHHVGRGSEWACT